MSGLWLPPSARRRPKLLRPDSNDYKAASVAEGIMRLSYSDFVLGMREEWESQFTEAERAGPVSLVQYMKEAFETLQWRLSTDIPEAFRRGSIDRGEYNSSVEFFSRLRDYTARFLREHNQ